MPNRTVESDRLPVLFLILLIMSTGCFDQAATRERASEPAATQTPHGQDEARVCASEWVTEASENAPGMEAWQGAGVGEATAYTGSGGQASVLVFPVIKDQEEVGYVTLDPRSHGCTVLDGGPGPPPSQNLPEARQMAAERLETSAEGLDVRLIHLETMTYLAEFTGPEGQEVTFNLQSLREYPRSR